MSEKCTQKLTFSPNHYHTARESKVALASLCLQLNVMPTGKHGIPSGGNFGFKTTIQCPGEDRCIVKRAASLGLLEDPTKYPECLQPKQ